MKFTLAVVAAFAAVVSAQNPKPGQLVPSSPAPPGCSSNYNGKFEITVVNATTPKRDLEKRAACGGAGTLVITLKDGVLTDAVGRTGAIVANHQFQFDITNLLQPDSIYTGGFSVCQNSSLAIGGSTTFFQCLSGTFYNLYDQSIGGQCNQILIDVIPCDGGSLPPVVSSASSAPASTSSAAASTSAQSSTSSAASTTAVTTSSASSATTVSTTAVVLSQMTDGQIQMSTATATASVAATTTKAAVATTTTAVATGAASSFGLGKEMAAFAAGVMAVALF